MAPLSIDPQTHRPLSGVRGGAVCVRLEGEGVMSQMKQIEPQDRAGRAELREAAAQEEALIDQLQKTTLALWRARMAKHALAHMSGDLPLAEEGC